jgi:SAM-dependent methyltransferase
MSAMDDPQDLQRLYRIRFGGEVGVQSRRITWQVLCEDWFPRYVRTTDVVLELGAGGCEFINNVRAARRIAVDLNPDVRAKAAPEVEFHEVSASAMTDIADDSVDVVFSSNFFEHLGTADVLISVLRESRRVLRPGGRLITLMPNLAVLGGRYYDFLDHTLPLTDKSLVEALAMADFDVDEVIPRFLPFTANDLRRPVKAEMVRAYLKTRPAWRILGKQMFVVAHRPSSEKR